MKTTKEAMEYEAVLCPNSPNSGPFVPDAADAAGEREQHLDDVDKRGEAAMRRPLLLLLMLLLLLLTFSVVVVATAAVVVELCSAT